MKWIFALLALAWSSGMFAMATTDGRTGGYYETMQSQLDQAGQSLEQESFDESHATIDTGQNSAVVWKINKDKYDYQNSWGCHAAEGIKNKVPFVLANHRK